MAEPSAPPPPQYYDINLNNKSSKGEKIKKLFQKYEISPLFREKLELLSDFKIVCIIDDSGSMNTPLNDGGPHATRWDELKNVVKTTVDIGTIYSNIDIHFLNRESVLDISEFSQLEDSFRHGPEGRTPLCKSLNEVLNHHNTSDKKILIVIATDGVPNNLDTFKHIVSSKNHEKFYISFLACSDNDSDIDYLNYLDKYVPHVDTLDDYASERSEVLAAQGHSFSYTYSDHIVRLLLGPICPELDSLDEKSSGCNWCNLL